MDDTTIIDLYFSRDEAAIRHTAEKYGGRLRALSHGIVQDMQTAEECENDTYLQAWNAIPPHDPKEYLYAFLARITRHISLNRCRDRRRLKRSAYICELSAELEQCIPAPDDAQCRLDDLALSEAINGFLGALDEAQMRALLDSAVSALGAAVRSVETVTAEGADTVTELRAATDRGELRAQADGTLVYLLPDGGLALPAGYSFTVSGTTDDAARETIAYLAERYSALLRMTAPVPVTGGDYNIYGKYRRTYAVYDAGETDAEGIANYNLCRASFVPTEDGRLGSIRIRNALAAAETLGDYPIVSADDARQRLRAGNYQTSVPCALPEDADIAGVELVYRTGSREQLLLPYYRFYVRLPDTDMEYADGLQLYGAYYVPAIADAYLENMSVYDGRFN